MNREHRALTIDSREDPIATGDFNRAVRNRGAELLCGFGRALRITEVHIW
jgi:hypothetical protein